MHCRADANAPGIASEIAAGAAIGCGGQVILPEYSAAILEFQNAVAQAVGRDDVRYRLPGWKTPFFIVAEEKRFVMEDRTTYADSFAVILERRFLLAHTVEVPGVGIVTIALMEPIAIPVKCVAAALADQGDLSTGSTAERGI